MICQVDYCKRKSSDFPVLAGVFQDGGYPDKVLFAVAVAGGSVRYIIVLEHNDPRYLKEI